MYLGMGIDSFILPAFHEVKNDRLIIDTASTNAKVDSFYLMNIIEIQINPKYYWICTTVIKNKLILFLHLRNLYQAFFALDFDS